MSAANDQKWVAEIQAAWDEAQEFYRVHFRAGTMSRGYPESWLDADRPTAEECLAALARVQRSSDNTSQNDHAARQAVDARRLEARMRVIVTKEIPGPSGVAAPRSEWFVTSYVGYFWLVQQIDGTWVLVDHRTKERVREFPTKKAAVAWLTDTSAIKRAADDLALQEFTEKEMARGAKLSAKYPNDADMLAAIRRGER